MHSPCIHYCYIEADASPPFAELHSALAARAAEFVDLKDMQMLVCGLDHQLPLQRLLARHKVFSSGLLAFARGWNQYAILDRRRTYKTYATRALQLLQQKTTDALWAWKAADISEVLQIAQEEGVAEKSGYAIREQRGCFEYVCLSLCQTLGSQIEVSVNGVERLLVHMDAAGLRYYTANKYRN